MNSAKVALLVLNAQTGDRSSFEKLCKAMYVDSYRFALKLTKHTDLAEDITQSCWSKVAKDLRKLKEPSAFKPWLFRIIYHQFIDEVRRRKETKSLTDNLGYQGSAETQLNSELDMQKLIERLNHDEKTTLYLFYFEEMAISEIAAVMGIAKGTVKSRLHRARQQLSDWYQ